MNEKSRLQNIDKYAARLLMVSFFLPMQPQVLVLFGMCAYFIFSTFKSGQRLPITNYITAICLGALYLLYLIAVPLTPTAYRSVTQTLCEYKMSYLLLPLVFASISVAKIRVILNELVYFIYGSIFICIVGNVWFVVKYALAPEGFRGVNHVTYRIFFEDLTGIHPTYISMYLVFGIAVLLVRGQKMNRTVKYIMFYTMLAFLLPLLAKSPLIAMVIMFAHVAWLRRKALARYKWTFVGVLSLMVLSYVFVPFVSQRVNEMAGIGTSLKQNVTDNSIHERKMIVSVDWSMVKQYWLTGCSPGRLLHLLKTRYCFYSLYYERDVNSFDPHNEYFYQWISFGLIGIILFAGALAWYFMKAIRTQDYLFVYLLLVFAITFFTESVLATQHGILLYSFFTALLFFNRGEVSETGIR